MDLNSFILEGGPLFIGGHNISNILLLDRGRDLYGLVQYNTHHNTIRLVGVQDRLSGITDNYRYRSSDFMRTRGYTTGVNLHGHTVITAVCKVQFVSNKIYRGYEVINNLWPEPSLFNFPKQFNLYRNLDQGYVLYSKPITAEQPRSGKKFLGSYSVVLPVFSHNSEAARTLNKVREVLCTDTHVNSRGDVMRRVMSMVKATNVRNRSFNWEDKVYVKQ